jgi:hypothetical protein
MQNLVKDERSIGDLFSELANETGTLVRQEVALAQAEMTKKLVDTGKKAAWIGVGGALGYAGVLAVTAALIALLSYVMPVWLSALIIGAVLSAAAYFTITSALEELSGADLAPTETVETLKEDAQWLKKQMSS